VSYSCAKCEKVVRAKALALTTAKQGVLKVPQAKCSKVNKIIKGR